MLSRRIVLGVVGLSALMLSTSSGCAARRTVSDVCVIERPNLDVIMEQIDEGLRELNGEGALRPATYEWLNRVDGDIDLFGEYDAE